MSGIRIGMIGGLGLSWLFAGLLAACSSDKKSGLEPGTTGGDTTASGGQGGASTHAGGANSTGGRATGGTGGVDCNAPRTLKCAGTIPPADLISDFTSNDAGTVTVFGSWSQSIFGGVYIYPATPSPTDPCAGAAPQYPLTSDTSSGSWHITGTVGTYSGGGMWFSCNTGTSSAPAYADSCTIDATGYTGISLTVSGSGGPISVLVTQPSTMKVETDSAGGPKNCGTCPADTCGKGVSVPVSSTPNTVNLTWAQLGVTDPSAITAIAFSLPDPYSYATNPPVATPYSVDLTIDDWRFTR